MVSKPSGPSQAVQASCQYRCTLSDRTFCFAIDQRHNKLLSRVMQAVRFGSIEIRVPPCSSHVPCTGQCYGGCQSCSCSTGSAHHVLYLLYYCLVSAVLLDAPLGQHPCPDPTALFHHSACMVCRQGCVWAQRILMFGKPRGSDVLSGIGLNSSDEYCVLSEYV